MLTSKQKEDEYLKMYLAHFSKEWLPTDNQDEKITLAALLGGVWPQIPFIAKLSRKTPTTLKEFMDRENKFFNAQDTFSALASSH